MQIKRDLTLTDVIAILGILGAIGSSYYASGARQSVSETRISAIEEARIELKKDIADRLDRIESKIDRLQGTR